MAVSISFHQRLAHVISGGERLAHHLFLDRPYIPAGVLLLCLAAAASYAACSVLQQREAAQAPPRMAMRLSLLRHLVGRPLWILGNLAGVAGFVFQFLALRHGSLALVQPLLVIGLVFALVAGAALDHRRPSGREVVWIVATVIGLALFIIVSQPGPGVPRGSNLGWALLGAVAAGGVGLLVLAARVWPRWRALSLGVAAGLVSGVMSALIERSAHLLDRGILHGLESWPPWALGACALLGLTLTQSAYQAGDIRLSLPALTAVEPIAAIAIGQVLFGEHIAVTGAAPVVEVLALAMMTVGVFGLGQTASVAVASE
jgi:drug/metabolite transporter (DMT)-like permease